ncbi:MAG TPA: hypothetical protein VLE94_19025 [Burkholderiaceae bacterium]|nr:hypothetical protein [Burkholderiaceae bacterium]HSB98959.1 hypothetical protein [Burkholderiaceae bacterium]
MMYRDANRQRQGGARRGLIALVAAAAVSALAACASTTYKTFQTSGDALFDGKGGTRAVYDGMDVWVWGDPPRRYKVLGLIDDERPGDADPMGRMWGDVVRKAREVGGEALIQVRNQSQIVGYQAIGGATAMAPGDSAPTSGAAAEKPVRRNTARFIVIRYAD